MNHVTLKRWNITFGGEGNPLVMLLGLNVLEDEGLAIETAQALQRVTQQHQLPFIFKASFDKANRSSLQSYRGPGLVQGLKQLAKVKAALSVPIVTDIHEPAQAEAVAEVADVVQIPAFLCRQTDLIKAAVEAVVKYDGLLHIKKAQFLAPWDCRHILDKVGAVTDEPRVILCERGTQFGYNNLVVDLLGIPAMQQLGVPVTIDATHSVQLPGADPRTGGASTGGRREGVAMIAKAAVAAGADGVFIEFHPEPDQAKCDGPSCLPLESADALLGRLKAIHLALSS